MEKVNAKITLIDGNYITIVSDYALYDNIKFDTKFSKNIEVKHLEHIIKSDNLVLSFERNQLEAFNNLTYENLNLIMFADKIIFDLKSKNTKIKNFEEANIKPSKIVCVIAAHRRLNLLNFVLWYLNKLDFYKIIAVYSRNDERRIIEKYKHKTVAVHNPNIPVSKKWQKGIKKSKEFSPDGVMILGSDDIITPGYLALVKNNIYSGVDYISNNIWYNTFITESNYYVGEFSYLKQRPDGLGSGRVYSKYVLNKLNWNLYNFNKNKALDKTSYNLARKYIKNKIILNKSHKMNVILLKTTDYQKSISVKNNFFKWVNEVTTKKKLLIKHSLYKAGESNVYELLHKIFFRS